MALDYRGWLQQNGNSWALNHVGNDYNNGKGGAGYDGTLQDLEIAAKVAGNTNLAVAPIAQDKYNRYNTIMELSRQYQGYLDGENSKALGDKTTAGSGVNASQNAADLAYLDDQEGLLKGMLGSAGKTLNDGITQINDSYNKETGRTNAAKSQAEADYGVKREDTTRGKQAAVGQVNSGARTLADSVRRMLGMASGTNSSAFKEAAPNLIARDATQKRSGVVETFGKNFRDIDSAETQTMSSFKDYLDDLVEQRNQKESGLRSGVLQQEQQINQSLGQIARDRANIQGGGYTAMRAASAPYQAEVSARQQQLDGLFEKFRTPFQTKDVAVAAPTLADYTVDRTQLQANGGANGESAYQTFLKKKFQEA